MLVFNYKVKDYKNRIKAFSGDVCNLCHGRNTRRNRCFDCLNKEEYLYYKERIVENKVHTIKMSFPLSEKQKEASSFFLSLFKSHENGYLNAVCGSGKTEIMYESILYALNNGDRVLFAIPRREIVRELKKRLDSVFVSTTIKILDAEHHDTNADLLISTINQLVHFENEFDLIIVDEADAYPYNTSDYLKRLVKKALKDTGSLFLMSATEYEKISYKRFTISKRYHKTPLSMPLFFKDDEPILNNEFLNIIHNNKRKYIIYCSSIKKARWLSEKLNTDYISSKEKISKAIDNLRNSKTNILVSTTLLERGITINGLDVVIYDASEDVFTSQVIIQICGRVGRSFEDNKGSIYIFYKENKLKFLKVKNYIRRMNEM